MKWLASLGVMAAGTLVAAGFVPLAAQSSSSAQVPSPRGAPLPERLTASTRAAIRALADSLSTERLPSYALLDKAAEGALKGADDARILAAVRALAQRVRSARALLDAEATDDELLAAAGALYAGVPSSTISRLAATHRARRTSTESLTVPLGVVGELATARVPADVALKAVDQLLSRGAADTDFRQFRATVDRSIRDGRTPRDATTDGVQRTLRGLDRVP
jgi:hypothetical protein